jgi:hypothetical protein
MVFVQWKKYDHDEPCLLVMDRAADADLDDGPTLVGLYQLVKVVRVSRQEPSVEMVEDYPIHILGSKKTVYTG